LNFGILNLSEVKLDGSLILNDRLLLVVKNLFGDSVLRERLLIARQVDLRLLKDSAVMIEQAFSLNHAGKCLTTILDDAHLMDLSNRDPHSAAPTMARLADALSAMRGHRAPACGKVALIDRDGTSRWASCEEAALEFGLRNLVEAGSRDHRIANAHDRLAERLRELAAAVGPRADYSVVHGELGLDHVLVDRAGNPVLIDIEALLYFDVEWEHVFLRIRHSDSQYRRLAVAGLDDDRLALYLLVQRLSLTAGPLRLLDGDFPNRAFMQEIAEHNLKEALRLVSAA